MTTVLAFGTFDKLHPGHEHYLREAKKLGDRLVVVIARDSTVEHIKGRLPQNLESVRRSNVKVLKIADEVVLGNEYDKFAVLEDYHADILALGYDQQSFITQRLEEELKKRGLSPKIVRISSFQPERYKSSLL